MSNKTDSLGNRMKQYEEVSRTYVTRRIPVIIRVDGKAFHTFTKGFEKPFDRLLMSAMQNTMKYLCENIQGCVFGYTQSDEITLVLTDYEKITTDAWFGYNIQKMASVTASMATLAFNKNFRDIIDCASQYYDTEFIDINNAMRFRELFPLYVQKFDTAMFGARAFSLPKEEVCNCLIWRQQDAIRNSIESVGQAYFSHKELHKKTCNQIKDMLLKECDVNWEDYAVDCKRGACCIKGGYNQNKHCNNDNGKESCAIRKKWMIDDKPPLFTHDREYVERYL